MATITKTWGQWYRVDDSLCILTPGGYEYTLAVRDVTNPMLYKVIFGQLSVKPWITTDDLVYFRQAVRELGEVK
jgi:hypothetical protein